MLKGGRTYRKYFRKTLKQKLRQMDRAKEIVRKAEKERLLDL